MPTPLLPRPATLLAACAVSLTLAACGGDDSSDATPSGSSGTSTTSGDADAGRVRLLQCLRENGVDIPDGAGQGGAPPQNLDRDKLQKALEGPCKELQDGAFGDISEADQQEFQDAFQKFSSCMRDEGVDVPNITPGSGTPPATGSIDTNDPDVKAAQEKCSDLLPQGGLGGAGQ